MVVAALLALSGCKVLVKEEPPPCPRVSILADASHLTRFRPGAGQAEGDVEFRARIVDYNGSCYYDRDEKTMSVTLQLAIEATRGPALTDGKRDLNYFVAVPFFFPESEAKKILPLTIDIPKGANGVKATDRDVRISFPVRNIKELERYELFVGLQLDEAELRYNRQHSAY
jgi:hypothetical protein